MKTGRSRWNFAAACAAAWLLVVQSALGAFASAAEQSPLQLDVFGNVICTHDGAGEIPAGDSGQHHLPACCVLGCAAVGASFVPPPGVGLTTPFAVLAVVFYAKPHADGAIRRQRSPINPRAPPQTA